MKIVYADHAATTKIKKEVLNEMMPYLKEEYGNPSAAYKLAEISKQAIEKAREQVKIAIGAENKDEIYFTSGGSEADNFAIKGVAKARKNIGKHIITSKIEHMAILNSCKELEEEGFEITYINVDSNGIVKLDELEKSIREDTILISIMFANNEIGTIEPVYEISKIAHKYKIPFHVDAVQAVGSLKIDVKKLGIDLLSLSAHKFYGPKGVGALYVKKGIDIKPIICGGHQENNLRAGTENVAGIVGIGKAIEIANNNLEKYLEKLTFLRNMYISEVKRNIPFAKINGHIQKRLPGNANISFDGINGGTLLLLLAEEGICCSSASACNTGSEEPSHVLKAIGLPDDVAKGTIRITFGEENTIEDVKYIIKVLKNTIERQRKK